MRYWSGFVSGMLTLLSAFFALFVARTRPNLLALYSEFKWSALPASTRLALSPIWSACILVAVVLSTIVINRWWRWSERLRLIALVITTAIAIVAMVWTIHAAYLPIFELAANIDAD